MVARARKDNESFKKYRANLKAEARLEKKQPSRWLHKNIAHRHTDGKVRLIPYIAKLVKRTLARGRG